MKLAIVIIVGILLLTASPSSPDTLGRIELAADAGGTNCNIVDTAPAVIHVHMLITQALAINGVQFRAPKPACWVGATWLADSNVFPAHIGDTQNDPRGLSIGFGPCRSSPVYLGSMIYTIQGQALPCCLYPVLKAIVDGRPDLPTPIMVACDDMMHGIAPGFAVVNPGPGCYCISPVPVDDTTWGAVKALYR
jgi:hypothetical protein